MLRPMHGAETETCHLTLCPYMEMDTVFSQVPEETSSLLTVNQEASFFNT